jgi:hypothetical protein
VPDLSAEQYQALVKSAPTHDEMMQEMGSEHEGHGD